MTQTGADVALSPYDSYGMSLAASAVTPAFLDVHNLPLLGLGTEEVEVSDGSPLVGQTPEHALPSASGCPRRGAAAG